MSKDAKDFSAIKANGLSSLADMINAEYGSAIAGIATEDLSKANRYSTGILSLDKYLVTGCMYGGRIVNAWGHEGTGKTLTAITVASAIQRTKHDPCPGNPDGYGRVAFLDVEGTFPFDLAKAVGLNTKDGDKFLIFRSTPERLLTCEDYINLIKILVQNRIEIIIVDSVAALTPRAKLESGVGESGQKSAQAIILSEAWQQITTLLNAFQRSIVWAINQMRFKPMTLYGRPDYYTGGEALKYYQTWSLEVKKRGDIIKEVPGLIGFEKRRIGVTVGGILHKNKTAAIPCDGIEFDVYFEDVTDKEGVHFVPGVDVYKDVFNVGLQTGKIVKSSSWFNYGDIKANGEVGFIAALRKAGPEVLDKIRVEILGK